MVKIRLFRTGAKNSPSFRVVATDSRTKRGGKVLEVLGFYNPQTKPATIRLKKSRIKYWLDRGGQLSDAVRKLINQDDGKAA